MKRFLLVMLLMALYPSAGPAAQQHVHHFPTPPESMDSPPDKQPPDSPNRRFDLAQAQREADDLARTAQTIPSDIASVRKGILPKDVIEKLKQIEKLSKHLRIELNP